MGTLRDAQAELAAAKAEVLSLLEVVREQQRALSESTKAVLHAASRIDHAVLKLVTDVVEEIESEGGPAPRKRKSSNLDTNEVEVKEVVKKAAAMPKLEKGKRACAKCRQTGHRSTTCQN